MAERIELNPDNVDAVMGFLREEITEDRTDLFIDRLMNLIKVPWVPKWLVRKVLDRMLPKKLLDAIEHVLRGVLAKI